MNSKNACCMFVMMTLRNVGDKERFSVISPVYNLFQNSSVLFCIDANLLTPALDIIIEKEKQKKREEMRDDNDQQQTEGGGGQAEVMTATSSCEHQQQHEQLRQRHVSHSQQQNIFSSATTTNTITTSIITRTSNATAATPTATATTPVVTSTTAPTSMNSQANANTTTTTTVPPLLQTNTQQQPEQLPQLTLRERIIAAIIMLVIVSTGIIGTYFLTDSDVMIPFGIAACIATISSFLFRYALFTLYGHNGPIGTVVGGRHRGTRIRHLRHHRHFSGERAEYVRASQRLAMMDRDFTAADYEMLLDLDTHSQRLRRFLEGASEEEIGRLPLCEYKIDENEINTCDALEVHVSNTDDDDDDDCAIQKKERKEEEEEEEYSCLIGATAKKCMICLEEFENGMMIRTLPCFHRFMSGCIDPWLTQQAKCPVCKKSIREEDMNILSPDS